MMLMRWIPSSILFSVSTHNLVLSPISLSPTAFARYSTWCVEIVVHHDPGWLNKSVSGQVGEQLQLCRSHSMKSVDAISRLSRLTLRAGCFSSPFLGSYRLHPHVFQVSGASLDISLSSAKSKSSRTLASGRYYCETAFPSLVLVSMLVYGSKLALHTPEKFTVADLLDVSFTGKMVTSSVASLSINAWMIWLCWLLVKLARPPSVHGQP